MTVGTGAPRDPLRLTQTAELRGNHETRGRTLRDPRIRLGEPTGVFIVGGQSQTANTSNAFYVPTHADKIDQISIFDGGCYAYEDSVIGPDGELGTWMGRFADKLIDAGAYERVIIIPYGIGGTAVIEWVAGADLNQRLTVASRRAEALGLPITAYLWQQGETDGQLGTSQANYEARLLNVVQSQRDLGFDAPWFIAKSTYILDATYSAIRAAQAAVVNGTDIFAGPDSDSLTGTTNRSDTTHFNATGSDANAELWKNAVLAAL